MFTPPTGFSGVAFKQIVVYKLMFLSQDSLTADQKTAWAETYPIANMMSESEYRSASAVHDRVRNYLVSLKENVPSLTEVEEALNRLVHVALAESRTEVST